MLFNFEDLSVFLFIKCFYVFKESVDFIFDFFFINLIEYSKLRFVIIIINYKENVIIIK